MAHRIASADNRIGKQVLRLSQKKERDETGRYLIEGPNLIQEAVKLGIPLELLLVSDGFPRSSMQIDGSEADWGAWDNILYEVSDALFQKLADTITPQGILAVVAKPVWNEEQIFRPGSNILVLDRVQDPGNLGTILRTADAADYGGILVIKGSGDLYNPKVVRAAAGSLFRLPVVFAESADAASVLCQRFGKRLICTAPRGSRDYFTIDMRRDIALVLGNEGNGISRELLAQAAELVKLPMAGSVESLNVAVAAGILLYESVRQNKSVNNAGNCK